MNTKSSATLAMGFGEHRVPYLYSDRMDEACRSIAEKEFDAVELLVSSPNYISPAEISKCLTENGLELSAIGTGGAYMTRKWHLCSPDDSVREAAKEFIKQIIDLTAPYNAWVILGLVTGIMEPGVTRAMAFDWLIPALNELGRYATKQGVGIVIEPVNRYESNLINHLDDGIELLSMLEVDGIKLLADLFHMNIEEASIDRAIRRAGSAIGHVHFSDSNRWAPGMGHVDLGRVIEDLEEIGYANYISIEAFPYPDSETAAARAIEAYRYWFLRQ